MNQAQVNITNNHKNMEDVFQQISQGSATVNLPTQQWIAQTAPDLHYPQEIHSEVVAQPARSLDNQSGPIPATSAKNEFKEFAKPPPVLYAPEDHYTVPVDEEQPQTGQEADSGTPEDSPSAKTTKRCLPSLPSSKENFAFGFDVELTKSDRFYSCVSVSINLFQKFLAYTAWIDCFGDTWETEVFVNQLTVAVLILTVLFRLAKNGIRKSWLAGLICVILDVGVLACYYGRGLHDTRQFNGGLDLNFKTVFYVVYIANLAGDLALAANLLLSKKTLQSGGSTSPLSASSLVSWCSLIGRLGSGDGLLWCSLWSRHC